MSRLDMDKVNADPPLLWEEPSELETDFDWWAHAIVPAVLVLEDPEEARRRAISEVLATILRGVPYL